MTEKDEQFVYVDVKGREVSEDDPAVQTRYTRAHFDTLDKGQVFGSDHPDAKKAAAEAERANKAAAEAEPPKPEAVEQHKPSAPAAGGGEDEDVQAFSEEAAKGARARK